MAEIIAFDSSVTEKLAGKVDKVTGKGLSTEDYTTIEKTKLAGIDAGAQKNPDLTPYAKKTEVAAKRDKTDNIAAADETQRTEWKCVCDNPFVQAYIDEQPPTVREFYPDEPGMTPWFTVIFTEGIFTIQGQAQVQCVGGDYPYDVPDGQLDHVTEMTFDRVYYVSPYVGTPEEWGELTSVEVRFTRTKVFTTKSGEPYVTPTGVKALVAPELHKLVPETSDTTVTLKPVDGAANWVDGVVGAGSFVETFSFKHVACVEAWNEDDDSVADFDAVLELDNTNSVIVNKLDSQTTEVILRATKNVDLYDLTDSTKHRGYIYEGAVLEFELAEPTDFTGTVPFRRELDASYWGEEAYIWDPVPNAVSIGVPDGYSQPGFYAVSAGSNPRITLPGSTGHARSFSLALTTDATTERAIEWQGGEVIEAVPGASKLVPGLTVWDVAEVAPGKFKVERASSPAQSAPLMLTAPNGRVAELTVGDDLVLEVKEV